MSQVAAQPGMVSRPGKRDCSELALALYRLAMSYAQHGKLGTLAEVTAAMRKDLPEVDHRMVADAISDATTGIRRERTDTQQRIDDLKREARRTSDKTQKEKIVGQIEELKQKLAQAPEPPPEKQTVPASKEVERLAYQRDRLRGEVRNRISALKPKSIFGQAGEIPNAARAVMTSIDVSAVLRQGGILSIAHPARAATSLGPMFEALASPQRAHAINESILNRPNAPLYARSKLYISPLDGPISKSEEAYMSKIAKKIPGVAGSERAYVTFLNKLRADSFDAMTNSLARNGQATQVEATALANFINKATGRGGLGPLENAAQGLAQIFFSPRYATSRFQLLVGEPLYGGTWRTRKLIATEYARYLSGVGVVLGLGVLAGGTVELDPRSSDFGKIKFGKTRLDMLAGLSQATTLVARMATGEKKDASGKVIPLSGPKKPYAGDTRLTLLGRFLRQKLAPLPGAIADLSTGENAVGEPRTIGQVALHSVVPLSYWDIKESMEEQGIPKGTALSILSLFGAGVQTYDSKKKHGATHAR